MNVKVITRHGPSNYGSLLQSFATVKAVEKLGHRCEIIDYRRPDERGLKSITTALNAKEGWRGNLLKRAAYIALRWPEEGYAQHCFDNFRHRLLKLTNKVGTLNELRNLDADVFMTGSDQVWGPIGGDPYDATYFLEFADGRRRVAYAASFGRTAFSTELMREYSRKLRAYDIITVREDSAADIIENMGLPRPQQVVDPTLLLDGNQWRESFGIPKPQGGSRGRYVLVYQIHNNPTLDDYATMIARHKGLPLYRVTPFLHQLRRGGRLKLLPSPEEFLSIIDNAELMVTDSFHGTAFAINLNTDFVEILPNNGTSVRNQSLLRLTGLTDRLISNPEDKAIADTKIDFVRVNHIIKDARERSYNIMSDLLTLN